MYDRCETIVTKEPEKDEEKKRVASALAGCGYPKWSQKERRKTSRNRDNEQAESETKCTITLPYCAGLSEKLTRIFRKHNTKVALKPERTVKDILVRPKDRTPLEQQCGAIYKIPCADCDAFYIGESARQLKTRVKEHKDSVRLHEGTSSAVGEHQMDTGHAIAWEDISILGIENRDHPRKVKEAIKIREQQPQLNRDQGLELPALYNRVITRSMDTHQ